MDPSLFSENAMLTLITIVVCCAFGCAFGWIFRSEVYSCRTVKREDKMIARMDDINTRLGMILQTLNVVCMDTVSILDAVDTEDKRSKPQEVILSRN